MKETADTEDGIVEPILGLLLDVNLGLMMERMMRTMT